MYQAYMLHVIYTDRKGWCGKGTLLISSFYKQPDVQ